jgi:hypothetical protein
MTPEEKKMRYTDEWQSFLRAKKWLEQWCASRIADGKDPEKIPQYTVYVKKLEKLAEIAELKWQQIKAKHKQGKK